LSAKSIPPRVGLTLNKKVATILAEILMVRFVPFTMTARSELNASGRTRLSPDAFAAAKKTTP
jgi:hypothetical protein